MFLKHFSFSLSTKVVAVFFTAIVALFFVLKMTLGITFDKLLSDNLQPYFTSHLVSLQEQVGIPPNINVAKKLAKQHPVIIEIDAPTYRWSSNDTFVEREHLDVRLQRLASDESIASEAGFYNGNFILRTFKHGYIISFIITEEMDKHENSAMSLAFLSMLFIVGILFSVVSYLFRPVQEIERSVKRIGDGDVSHRLNITRGDELGSLSNSINKMANNIEGMLDAKRQLLLAISHELRTPITRSKLALSMLDDEEVKDSIAEDMDEMESLIKELLESERLRGNHAPLEYHHVNVNEVIYQVHGRFFDKSPLELSLDENLPDIDIDPKRIGLAIKNVIKNAFTASLSPKDKVIVSTESRDNHVIINIRDFGTGIAAEDIPRITEPFYRPDSSRQRKTGGFGIGLYLIKEIIEAHHGKLQFDSTIGVGTTVKIVLPKNNPQLKK